MRDLERAVNNPLPQVGTSDFASFFKGYTGAYAWEAPEAYLRVSPWSYAKDITTTNRKAGPLTCQRSP